MLKIGWKTAWAVSVMCAITAIVSPAQTFTTLHSFEGRDGQYPYAGLVQATDGSLYGITADGGGDGGGTVFKISPNGAMTTLYRFCAQPGTANTHWPRQFRLPMAASIEQQIWAAPMTMARSSRSPAMECSRPFTFYGTTVYGGASGDGTVFSLSVGLGAFVATLPTSTTVGAGVRILGTNLTGATSVTFNGTPAVFKVASSSFITTTVPAGATSGKVQVVTPGGTLTSNVPFRVLP
ncbi:MAG TPA: choice-of-anchor tandem repeat GloVer-containing protein [Terriglobia bacterium]|nr:choice-of-anchor tandem repeat GloVer-containing protein [Terriglobia bacterium]